MSKLKNKNTIERASVRIKLKSKQKSAALLKRANDKEGRRSIKFEDLFELAIDLVQDEHLKVLQEKSLTNEDRKERLRQKYAELHGSVTRDEFTGIMMRPEFFEFLKTHGHDLVAA